jgi:hypothetical protein
VTDLRIITRDGTDAILEEATVQNFAESLRGPLLQPGNGRYDEARKVERHDRPASGVDRALRRGR